MKQMHLWQVFYSKTSASSLVDSSQYVMTNENSLEEMGKIWNQAKNEQLVCTEKVIYMGRVLVVGGAQ